jgi:hypothetical protein
MDEAGAVMLGESDTEAANGAGMRPLDALSPVRGALGGTLGVVGGVGSLAGEIVETAGDLLDAVAGILGGAVILLGDVLDATGAGIGSVLDGVGRTVARAGDAVSGDAGVSSRTATGTAPRQPVGAASPALAVQATPARRSPRKAATASS